MNWKKSKNSEDTADQAYQKKREPGMQSAGTFPLEKQGFDPVCGPRGDEKDGDVEPISKDAQDTGIGVVDQGDQNQSQQDPRQLDTPELPVFRSHKTAFDESEQEHWIVDQLHMLPDGFVDRRNQGSGNILAAQVIEKVQKGS